jgi:hypothetical protein
MNLKKILFWAAVILIGYMLIHQPTQSAGTVHHMLSSLQIAAEAIISFVNKVLA